MISPQKMALRKSISMYYRSESIHQARLHRLELWAKKLYCTQIETRDDSLQKYTITTPIFYVNAVPHIGHLYTATLADALARWQRIKGKSVLFATGTDEHGLKIQKAAAEQSTAPKQFCDKVSQEFKALFNLAGIRYDDFIRTTESRHKESVHRFWNTLVDRGYIYKGTYEGWYCTSDEAFITPDLVTEVKNKDGSAAMVSSESGHTLEWTQEENYMFRLSHFTDALRQWLDKSAVRPAPFEYRVRSWLDEGLSDLSVSRQRSRLHWGIPVPDDDSQTIYVWLDALVNYLTVTGYPNNMARWPADCHIVGKDILRFHAVYWPAFLMGAGLDPPSSILCHSHWLMDNEKMSKSKGNVVDPTDRINRYTVDGMRYFLLRVGVPHSDGNYNDQKVIEFLNAELANTFGNLFSRCTAKSLNVDRIYPEFDEAVFASIASGADKKMLNNLYSLPSAVDGYYEEYNIHKAIDVIMAQLRETNAFFDHHKPWVLAKSKENAAALRCILYVTMETLRICGLLLQPVTPTLSNNLLTQLNILPEQRMWSHINSKHPDSSPLLQTAGGPLFQRLKSS